MCKSKFESRPPAFLGASMGREHGNFTETFTVPSLSVSPRNQADHRADHRNFRLSGYARKTKYGKRLFEENCNRGLEGIVAKRKLSIYKDDGQSWLKIKNRAYSQAEGRHELLTRKP